MKSIFTRIILLMVLGVVFSGEQIVLSKPKTVLKTDPKQRKIGVRKANFNDKIGKLPVLFEENKGQSDEDVKFLLRTKSFNLFLASNKAVYQMPDPGCQLKNKERRSPKPCKSFSLTMKMLAGNAVATIRGVGQSATKSGYYIGNDKSKWLDNLSNYNAVEYENVYQGIDVIFRGSEQKLEYDFRVAPGANVNLIRLGFEKIKNAVLSVNGDLVFKYRSVEMRHQKPIAYQIVNGERREISASYVLLGKNRVGFKIGDYDREKELIIDPIVYASYLGYKAGDRINDIAVDRQGNIYTALEFENTVIRNGVQDTYRDVMISKFDTTKPPQEQRIWVKIVGGSQDDSPYGMDVDDDGRVYVTGITYSPDFPLNFAAQNTPPITRLDSDYTGFVFQLSPNGEIHYSTYLGGSCPGEDGESIVADSNQNAYVTGSTCSTNFNAENGFQTSLQGTQSAFLTKFDLFGRITYSTYFGSGSFGADVFTDGAGNAFITGSAGNGVYTTPGAYSPTGSGFIAKFDTTKSGSNSLVFSTRVAKSAAAIAADRQGNSWAALSSIGFRSFDSANIIKLNNTGSAILFESPSFGQQIRDLAVDQNGSAYFAANIWANNNSGGIRSKIYGCARAAK